MKDKVFLDTNVFVYAIDSSPRERKKRDIARELISKTIERENGVISIQVVQEFFQVSTQRIKVPISIDDAIEYLKYISIMEIVIPQFEMVILAARLHQKYQFSFWDAMIIQAALTVGCKEIHSEDMQDGLIIDDIKITDPFKKMAHDG
jgi:predicted nucleic acid-binding protein